MNGDNNINIENATPSKRKHNNIQISITIIEDMLDKNNKNEKPNISPSTFFCKDHHIIIFLYPFIILMMPCTSNYTSQASTNDFRGIAFQTMGHTVNAFVIDDKSLKYTILKYF